MIYEVKWSSKFKKGYRLAKYRNSGLRAGVFCSIQMLFYGKLPLYEKTAPVFEKMCHKCSKYKGVKQFSVRKKVGKLFL